MLKHFFVKIAIVILPFIIIMFILLDVALKLGDANPPSIVIWQQKNNPDLIYMPAWTRSDQFYYKFTAVNAIQPDVLIIGSSRVYHWRADVMFDDSGVGYNAGIPSAEPLEVEWFLDGLAQRGALPDVIILAIDDLFFNQQGNFVRSNRVESVIPPFDYSFGYAAAGLRSVARNYVRTPLEIRNFYRDYTPSNYLGQSARESGRGYRADGSFHFPDLFDVSPHLIANHEDLYTNNRGIFQQGLSIYQPSLDALDNILRLASDNDIEVVGIYTPYNANQYRRMMDSGNYSYIPLVRQEIESLFANYDMPLLDYTFAETIGGIDEELYDYLHAGEVLGLRVYLDILRQLPDIFAPYSDAERLEAILERVDNRFFLP